MRSPLPTLPRGGPARFLLPLIALIALAAHIAPEPVAAEDLSSAIASEEERRGDLETLRTDWLRALIRDPDSELSYAILVRFPSALAMAPGPEPSAADWQQIAERMGNGWSRRRALGYSLAAARAAGKPWGAAEVGLDAGTLRDWLVIGPFGRNPEAELHTERAAALDFDLARAEEGRYGPVRWEAVLLLPHETLIEPARRSWRRGAGWVLRSRFRLAEAADGFLEVSTRGSLRLLIDGQQALLVDRAAEHLPRMVRVPLGAAAGAHEVVVKSDGAPFSVTFVDPKGNAWPIEALPAAQAAEGTGWRPLPGLPHEGLPDLTDTPFSAADRAVRLLLAAENEDPVAIDRLLPGDAEEGEGAPALGLAVERALPQLDWLPGELERSRLEDFRRAALAADPELVPIAIAAARTSAAEDKVGDAMRSLDAIVARAPRSLEAWLARESIAREHGWRRERRESLAAIIEIDGDHPLALRRQRELADEDGRGDREIDLIAREFARDATSGAGPALVRALARAGRAAEAERVAQRLESLSPGSPEVLRLHSNLAEMRGDDAALEQLVRQIEAEFRPGDPDPFDRLAEFRLARGDAPGALVALEEAAARDPGESDRALRIAHLRAGAPPPGSEAEESWESELVPIDAVLAAAPPPGSYPGANAVLLLDHMVSDVSADAGLVEVIHQVIRLESQEAVEAYSTLPTSGEVRELWVRTPDGRILEPTGGGESGSYTLPGLEPGALIVVRTVRRQDVAEPQDLSLGPFYFRDPEFAVAFHRSEWIVRIPAEWEVDVIRRGGAPAPVETPLDRRRRLAWRVDGADRPEPEPLSPPPDRILPNVQIRAPLAWEVALPQLATNALDDDRPTPTLVAAAAEILAEVPAGLARVRALHAAVCDRIPDEGGGGSATEVWLARAGDRDLALAGLLRAARIPFRRVFAAPSPERIPWVDWEDPREASFQLLLLEVTDDGGSPLWVHVPARLAPFGRLPPEIRRGRALRLDREGGEWFAIPDGDPLEDAQALTGTITLEGETPSAQLSGALEIRALAGSRVKEQIKDMPAFLRSTMLERFVQQTLPGAKVKSGEFQNYDGRDLPMRIAFDVDAPSLVQVRDGTPSLASTLLPSALRRTFVRSSTREWPVQSPIENTIEERLTIRLGDRFTAADLPADVDLEGPWGRFRMRTTASAGELLLERRLELRPFSIEADRWPEFVEFCRQVDLREEARIPLGAATP